MCGGGFHAAGCDPHGIIHKYVQLFGVVASAPYWSGILCAAVNNCKVCCLEGLAFAPQVDSDRHRMKLFLAITFPRRPSTCCLYVSCLSSFTPRYFGCGL